MAYSWSQSPVDRGRPAQLDDLKTVDAQSIITSPSGQPYAYTPGGLWIPNKDKGIYVYDPKSNSWADPIPFPADGPKFPFAANTFFDQELNAYFCHFAGDSNDDGVMWVYRHKK